MFLPPKTAAQEYLGIVIAVPEPWANQLRRARSDYDYLHGAVMDPHITLLPPTAVARSEMTNVAKSIKRICAQFPAFSVELKSTASFQPVSPVTFVPVVAGAPQCTELQRALRTGPLSQELRFPYHPHVTIAQEVAPDVLTQAQTELRDFAAVFPVTEVSLERCQADGSSETLEVFQLAKGFTICTPRNFAPAEKSSDHSSAQPPE